LFGDIWGRAALVVLGAFVCQFGLSYGYMNSPLLTQLTSELGWTRAQFSTLGDGWRVLVTALGHPLFGWLTLRFGGKPVLIGAVASIAVAGFGLSRMHSLWELMLWQTLLGFVQVGVSDMVAGQVVSEWIEKRRGLALGLVYAGPNAGAAVMVNAVAWIATRYDWREAYLLTGIAGAVLLLPFAIFAVRPPRPGEGARDAARAGDAPDTSGDLDLRQALRTRSFWALAFGLFAFFAYFLGVISHFVPYLQDQGMELRTAAGFYSTAVFLGVFSKPLYGLFSDLAAHRAPARPGLLINTGICTASAFLTLALPNLGVLWLWIATYGITSTARDVVYPLIIIDTFGVKYLATIYGALMLGLLGGPIGSTAAGYVHDVTGSYDGAFALLAGLNLLGFLGLFLVRREIPAKRAALEET
jgi:nitrate/nitrite transporter NarK